MIKHKIVLNTIKKGKKKYKEQNNQSKQTQQQQKSLEIKYNPITKNKLNNFSIHNNQKLYQQNSSQDQSTLSQLILHQNSNSQWKIQNFQIIQQLGRGKFGQVYAVLEKKSDFIVALKKMSRLELTLNNFQKQIKREIIIQSSLRHQNILKMFGYFWDQNAIYLILEYAPGGQLYNKLKTSKKFDERTVSVIIRQVCYGLQYLHSKNIIHRDIKPQNLLISLGQIKLADFGWSIHSNRKRDTLCGTLDYLAPQMVKGDFHDCSVDIWQVGVLAYELAVGCPPFETNSYDQTYQKIINSQVNFPSFISFELRKFIRRCLQKRPQKRMKIQDCLNDDFITNYIQEQLNI